MKQRGFTLIELLVVIAIIAILAAILFPVFAQARAKARQATCTSNVRQMALALNMYCQDFDERLPLAATAPDAFTYYNWHDLVTPYVKNVQIWICPSAVLPIKDIFGKPVCHYGYNAVYLNDGVDPPNLFWLNNAPGISIAPIDQPTPRVAMVDAEGIQG